ncbi:rhodanese-like domain-containing protein [Leptolyngbya cf. ectocarpi LEGE 11479]|uniref:Rhodanese-like domain-containing protein n=1 Tax=Leptolyngbya cf. ectocarpi LEGE 11479 TaxID=1828722 RepID=A0A928ZZF4_LEPEC|nr:rhodanese-like domain-containing protein [Leptolyngbya ectocarpi]MBE9070203.1 rhodanese-like domain-containing protein [Leptolyngbya cf. ectocarpi LEGE 11479]
MSVVPKYPLQEIDVITLKQWLENQEALLLDVREPAEYAAEHIPGARLMPLSSFDANTLWTLSDRKIVLQCQSGKRSAQAAQKMFEAGFDKVAHLQGGLPTWKAAGYPTKVNKNAPISMFRQVQIVAGSLVFLGTVLGALVSPWFLLMSGFIGAGLVFAGVTNTCAMAMLLAKLPYNQRAVHKGSMVL